MVSENWPGKIAQREHNLCQSIGSHAIIRRDRDADVIDERSLRLSIDQGAAHASGNFRRLKYVAEVARARFFKLTIPAAQAGSSG